MPNVSALESGATPSGVGFVSAVATWMPKNFDMVMGIALNRRDRVASLSDMMTHCQPQRRSFASLAFMPEKIQIPFVQQDIQCYLRPQITFRSAVGHLDVFLAPGSAKGRRKGC